MTQLRHYDHWGTARFITFSCYRRYRVFDSPAACDIMIQQLARLRDEASVKLLGYVLMPEHVHLIVWPPLDAKLGLVIGQMKARAAHGILQSWNGDIPDVLRHGQEARQHQVFQRRCYDHNCRTVDTVKEKIEYCHKNPVTRGLVQLPGEWHWSSYNWYMGRRDVPLAMDEVEL